MLSISVMQPAAEGSRLTFLKMSDFSCSHDVICFVSFRTALTESLIYSAGRDVSDSLEGDSMPDCCGCSLGLLTVRGHPGIPHHSPSSRHYGK